MSDNMYYVLHVYMHYNLHNIVSKISEKDFAGRVKTQTCHSSYRKPVYLQKFTDLTWIFTVVYMLKWLIG